MKKIKYFYDRNGYKRRLRKKNPVAGVLYKSEDDMFYKFEDGIFYTYSY